MTKIIKVKNANKVVKDVFRNGLKQLEDDDFILGRNGIKFFVTLKKKELVTIVQETTVVV